MRAYQFLLEYDRSREQQRIESLPSYQSRLKQDPEFSLEKLESADPTPQKIYVPRLAQWWLTGEPVEDLISTVADALAKYHTLKTKKLIKPEHADIGRFRSAEQFQSAVDQYQTPGQKETENRGQYKTIHRDDQMIVVELLDETAAKFWGRGTRWCTAANKKNAFLSYHKRGPLYVIIPRSDTANRYQLWWDRKNPYEYQFMNAVDKSANPMKLPFYTQLASIMAPLHDHIMWKTNLTPAEQLAAVKQNGLTIQFIPNPSSEVQLTAVQQDGFAIRHIRKPSTKVQLAAVQQAGWVIRWIKNPSPEVQLAAVQKDESAIQFIANPSLEVQLAAVRQKGTAIYYIPNPSPKVQLAAVQQNVDAIRWILNPSPEVVELERKLRSTK